VSLVSELLEDEILSPQIESITAIPSSGGRFEIIVNDELVYSKKATGRHAEPGEVHQLVLNKLNS
jgi:selenoprotein W-related protein